METTKVKHKVCATTSDSWTNPGTTYFEIEIEPVKPGELLVKFSERVREACASQLEKGWRIWAIQKV